ncbi:MAG: universal stress protein [Saprospiraceae bacterium]
MTNIQIIGNGDADMRALRHNLGMALSHFPLHGSIEEVMESQKISSLGIQHTPAIIVDGEILSEGNVPTVQELEKLLCNRELLHSNLYALSHVLVPVDLSPASENALLFACHLVRHLGASMEVVYVMDSIFQGSKPSPSGFLSAYRGTMQDELDNFVRGVFEKSGSECPILPAGLSKSVEKTASGQPMIQTRIDFGFPEDVISNLSSPTGLVVMGTTGRGNISRNLFGSVSIAVSKKAKGPVLLIPPQATFKGFQEMVYASNFESLDQEVVKETVGFSRRFNSQIHFVHVGESEMENLDLERRLFGLNYLFADPEKPFIFQKIEGEDLVDALHEYAFINRADLFVFVTHERTFWESLLHKSMSKEMLLHTSAPVLVMHTEG